MKQTKLRKQSSYYYARTKSTLLPRIVNCKVSTQYKLRVMSSLSTIAISSEVTEADVHQERITNFDTDSFLIGVDNRSSYCMTPSINDFVTPMQPAQNLFVRGIGGLLQVQGRGSVKWNIVDDSGMNHEVIIPGTLYVKGIENRLLSPQHWSQTANDNFPSKYGTRCVTYGDKLVLEWNQCQYSKTIPVDKRSNTFSFYSVPGTTKFMSHTIEME